MRHPIDPKVDCVFKALLGAESNRDLLIHFLNAVLGAERTRRGRTICANSSVSSSNSRICARRGRSSLPQPGQLEPDKIPTEKSSSLVPYALGLRVLFAGG